MSRIISPFFGAPSLPPSNDGVLAWIRGSLYVVLNNIYRILGDRSEEMIQEGTLANIPAAQGRRRFYYATDTEELYYDAGTWKKI